VSQSFSDLAADLMKAPIAAAMMGGSDELSDQNSNWDMRPIPVPMRARAYPFCDWHRSFTKGAALFSSLKSTTAAADKHTLATIPMLNLFHEQRAYADARILADEEPEITRPQLAVVRALTARTPAEFAELWATAASPRRRRAPTPAPPSRSGRSTSGAPGASRWPTSLAQM